MALAACGSARADVGLTWKNRTESYLYFTRGGSTYTSFLLKQDNSVNWDPWALEAGVFYRKGYGAFDGVRYTAEERGGFKLKTLYRFDPHWSAFHSFSLAGDALEDVYRTYANEGGIRNFGKDRSLYYVLELAYRRESYSTVIGADEPKDFLATYAEVGWSISEASRLRAWTTYRPRFTDWGDFHFSVEPGIDVFFSKTFYFRTALLYSYRSVKTWDGDRRWDTYGHFGLGYEIP